MSKLSVVISTYNGEEKLEECLKSVVFADEIVIVNNSSTDKTLEIAKKYTSKIFQRPNNPMLNVNKNFGFSKASGDWILSLDDDERVTPELALEIKAILARTKDQKTNGYKIPRKNIIFGKWMQHSGWYPDYQLRLFKKGKGKFAQKHVHEMLTLEGEEGVLKGDLMHLNYQSVSQFLDKMIRIYTTSEAQYLTRSGYKLKLSDSIKMPTEEFLRRFFLQKGYKDGAHGLVLSLLMSFYHLVVFTKLWEMNKFKDLNESTLQLFKEEFGNVKKEVDFWVKKENEKSVKNVIRKILKLK